MGGVAEGWVTLSLRTMARNRHYSERWPVTRQDYVYRVDDYVYLTDIWHGRTYASILGRVDGNYVRLWSWVKWRLQVAEYAHYSRDYKARNAVIRRELTKFCRREGLKARYS